MRQLGTEEKAALLLTSIDDDDDDNIHELPESPPKKVHHDNFPTVSKRPKTYHRHHMNNTHPVLFFIIILSVFIFGCLSGVVIMLYRISQDTEKSSFLNSPELTKIDLSIKTKLSKSIIKNNFLNLTYLIESENDSAKNLEENWQKYSKIFNRVNKISYDVTLSTYSPSIQWSGIQLFDINTNQEITKFNLLQTNDYLTFSSLIKSGKINGNFIYYVNYGREEDFAYLIKQNQINFENNNKTIIFMRRKSIIISQTEQIRQAIHYKFAGLVLFDDDEINPQLNTTNDRQSFSSDKIEQKKFLNKISNEDDQQIFLLILSYSDVQNIFSSIPLESNKWLSSPLEWHNKSISIKLGGQLKQTKLLLTSFIQEIPVHLPVVFGFIRGTIDEEHFIMIGYQLGRKQQEKILNEIIRIYEIQINNGWRPRRSIIFCGWSGLSYDHYPIQRWISDNYNLIKKNLIAYIDLGNGIIGNSTLNLHGSPLFQQIATNAADFVVSPLVHDHSCHHRQKPTTTVHIHRKRHDEDHQHHITMNQQEENSECEPHKLLDEWIRASNNRIGINLNSTIVQMIDSDSSAALFQLKYGIPSLIIEMTDEQSLTNDTFYLKKSPPIYNNEIQPEVIVAYTQFITEIIRQLIDQPLIPFNLTDYANLIDKQTKNFLFHYEQTLVSHLGDKNEINKIINDLIKTIQDIQLLIDQIPKNNYLQIQKFNEKIIQFERLFINNDQLYKHIFLGPAYGLTNTVVPYPSLSNLLFNIGNNPQVELIDELKLRWSKFKEHIQLITKTLKGFDGLFSNI